MRVRIIKSILVYSYTRKYDPWGGIVVYVCGQILKTKVVF